MTKHFSYLWKICLSYGICYFLFAYRNPDGIGSGIFALISSIFIVLIAKKLEVFKKEVVFYLVAAVLISFGSCLTDNGFFLFFNHVGSLLLYSISCIKFFYEDTNWGFGKYFVILINFFCNTIAALPLPFKDFAISRQNVAKKMSSTKKSILIGILCGLPILFIITLLLASADRIFADLLHNIFNLDGFFDMLPATILDNMITFPLGFTCYTLLLYLVFGALQTKKLPTQETPVKKHGAVIAITIFSMIDVVYVLFCSIQFLYLFTGNSTNSLGYAEYARQGFFQLLFVAFLNFVMVLFFNKHFEQQLGLQIAMTITCACTFILIISSAYRMLRYINAYNLTFLRVFVLWFLLMLAVFMIGTTLSIYKENFHNFQYCLIVLTCFYTVFALCGVDKGISHYNVNAFETQINSSSQPALDTILPSDYHYSMAYAADLSNLLIEHENELTDYNVNLIKDYLRVLNHFTDNYSIGSSYIPSFILYDPKEKTSIFSLIHYNFVEATCYKNCIDK